MSAVKAEQGRKKRQQILDYLHKVGVACDAGTLLTATKETERRTMVARLQRMHEIEELHRESRLVGGNYVYFYTPRVKITVAKFEPTIWAKESKEAKRNVDEIDYTPAFVPQGPWHTGNRCSDKRRPHPAQGGQGSVSNFYSAGSVLTRL